MKKKRLMKAVLTVVWALVLLVLTGCDSIQNPFWPGGPPGRRGGGGDGGNGGEGVTALWARTITAGYSTDFSGILFEGVAVAGDGSVYAVGYQDGISFTYGPGVSPTGTSPGDNPVVVKYDSSGTALWARTITAGDNNAGFNSVAVDGGGNVYAAGTQAGSGTYTYGPGVSATGTTSSGPTSGYNPVLVKYDSLGTALWAQTITASNADNYPYAMFYAVAVGSDGSVYAAGIQGEAWNYTYGPGVSIAGTSPVMNPVLVKYR